MHKPMFKACIHDTSSCTCTISVLAYENGDATIPLHLNHSLLCFGVFCSNLLILYYRNYNYMTSTSNRLFITLASCTGHIFIPHFLLMKMGVIRAIMSRFTVKKLFTLLHFTLESGFKSRTE